MSKRDKTPNLMDELMSGKTAGEQPSKPAGKAAAQPESQEEPKIKATHYLRESTLFRLEQALLGIRMSSGRRDINRYDVVEQALQITLADYEERGPESELAKRLQ